MTPARRPTCALPTTASSVIANVAAARPFGRSASPPRPPPPRPLLCPRQLHGPARRAIRLTHIRTRPLPTMLAPTQPCPPRTWSSAPRLVQRHAPLLLLRIDRCEAQNPRHRLHRRHLLRCSLCLRLRENPRRSQRGNLALRAPTAANILASR